MSFESLRIEEALLQLRESVDDSEFDELEDIHIAAEACAPV